MTRAQDDLARLLDGDAAGRAPAGTGPVLEALALARQDLDGPTSVRPEFRDALRTRLLAVAAVQPAVPAPVRAPLLRSVRARRRLAALSGALAGVVALSGVGVAASRSVPGDLFYGAKRTAEDVRLGVAGGDQTEQGLRRLQLATARLAELEALAQDRRTLGLAASRSGVPLAAGASRSELVDVLDDMDEDVRDGSRLMLDGFRATGDPAPLVVLRGWSVEQAARLRALFPQVSAALLPRVEGSLALVRGVEASAVQLLEAPAPRSAGLGDAVADGAGVRGVAPGLAAGAGRYADQRRSDQRRSDQRPADQRPAGRAVGQQPGRDSGPSGQQQPGTGPRPTAPVQEQVPVPPPACRPRRARGAAAGGRAAAPRAADPRHVHGPSAARAADRPGSPDPVRPSSVLPSPVLPSPVVPRPVLPSAGLPTGGLPLPTPPVRRLPAPGRVLPDGLPTGE